MDWTKATDIVLYNVFYTRLLEAGTIDPVDAHNQAVNMVTVYNAEYIPPIGP